MGHIYYFYIDRLWWYLVCFAVEVFDIMCGRCGRYNCKSLLHDYQSMSYLSWKDALWCCSVTSLVFKTWQDSVIVLYWTKKIRHHAAQFDPHNRICLELLKGHRSFSPTSSFLLPVCRSMSLVVKPINSKDQDSINKGQQRWWSV